MKIVQIETAGGAPVALVLNGTVLHTSATQVIINGAIVEFTGIVHVLYIDDQGFGNPKSSVIESIKDEKGK